MGEGDQVGALRPAPAPLQGLWLHDCKIIMITPPWTLLIPSIHPSVRQRHDLWI